MSNIEELELEIQKLKKERDKLKKENELLDKSEAKLRSSEQNLRVLKKAVDTTHVGITISSTDGKILYTNEAEAEMHGYDVSDLVGSDVGIFAPPSKRDPIPVGEYGSIRKMNRESVNIRKDGSVFPVFLRSDAVFKKNGEPLGIVTICENITEKKQIQNKLEKSEQLFRLLAENARDLIYQYHIDPEHLFEYVSPAVYEITGYSQEEFYKDPNLIYSITHPEDMPALDNMLNGMIEEDDLVELRWFNKGGEIIWVEHQVTNIYDAGGKLIAIQGIARDISHRVRVGARVKEE